MNPTEGKFKFIGGGAVVRAFLSEAAELFPHITFQVYARAGERQIQPDKNVQVRTVSQFSADDRDVIFFCCAENEEEIIRNSKAGRSRFAVAQANFQVTSEFIRNGAFDRGLVFVLTNPSDLVAEYIYRETGNHQTFALGLSADFRRYLKLFDELGLPPVSSSGMTLGGNHWDHPFPCFDSCQALKSQLLSTLDIRITDSFKREEILLRKLNERLRRQIDAEFLGCKPPVKSGATAMIDLVRAFCSGGDVLVSGMTPELRNFMGGILRCKRGDSKRSIDLAFRPIFPSGAESEAVLSRVFEKHRRVLAGLMDHVQKRERMIS